VQSSTRKRRILLVLLLIGSTAMAMLTALVAPRYVERHRFAAVKDGCADVPMAPMVTPQTYPDSFPWPYGAVYACNVLDGGANPLSAPDVSFILLLETDKGPVLTRMDYYDIRAARRYVAEATELGPKGFDRLAAGEVARINQAIAARGGRQPTPWVVHYGDG
jgi:hypothetical protein